MHGNSGNLETSGRQGAWVTTHWSVVLSAQDPSSPGAAQALDTLCRTYWYPLYAYARRAGQDEHSARDLTQGFFARVLEKNYFGQADRKRGRFRTFLLTAFKNFAADEYDKANAKKRGGGVILEPLEVEAGEHRYVHEPVDRMDPEKLYERRWALTLLESAWARLEKEFADAGKAELFKRLQAFEGVGAEVPAYAEVAAELGLTEGGLRAAVSRMRRRYRELIRDEVAQTVNNPAEVDEELRYLLRIISG
jgi:RNA polymerase sigma factor (sigma-70 family)